ncbi:MAG: Lrp/AsnC family transcriptional regulator [Rhodobacter sp.]|nr:Lrp/AsnC family transcriptional regulator [Rhodobacter sp.]
MDDIDGKIIGLLAADARRALADIGAHVGLSPSAVNERIRRLNGQGIVRRFTVDTDPEARALPILAFVWIALPERGDEAAFRDYAASHSDIEECHHVTGPWSYLLKIRVGSLASVEAFLTGLKAAGFVARSETMLALSSPVPGACVPRGA